MGQTASFDARPGGEYRVGVISGHTAAGEFVELDPPRRLGFTWGWEGGTSEVAPGTSTIEIELVPHRRRDDAAVPSPRLAERGVRGVARARLGALPRAARHGRVGKRPGRGSVAVRRDGLSVEALFESVSAACSTRTIVSSRAASSARSASRPRASSSRSRGGASSSSSSRPSVYTRARRGRPQATPSSPAGE
jgi:hypothetical protein